MMSISHCYCSDYMTKPTQFGDEPLFFGHDTITVVVGCTIATAKVQRHYNCYNVYLNECLPLSLSLVVRMEGRAFVLFLKVKSGISLPDLR